MKYHIVSIGISKHSDSSNNLQFAHKDAQEFHTLFTQNVGNLGYQKLLVDNEATLSNIRSSLGSELQHQIAPEDCFIMFYSGHGSVAKNSSGDQSHFLIPFDVTADIENTGIPVDYIKDIFNKLNCQSKLMIVDSCFSGSVNSKYFGPIHKGIHATKTISNEISGEGSVVFTACKDDEQSLEDLELSNGVFTSFVLKELQLDSSKEKLSVTDLHTPIVEKVSAYTMGKYHFKQSPTFSGHFKSPFYLPSFKKPIIFTPNIIKPIVHEEQMSTFSIPKIELSDDAQALFIEQTISLVVKSGEQSSQFSQIEFERLCYKVLGNIKKQYEKKMDETGSTWESINQSVNFLMAESFQLFVLSSVVGIYGTEKQVKILGEMCSDMLTWKNDKSGLIAALKITEVIVLMVQYLLTIMSILTANFNKLKVFLDCRVFDYRKNYIPKIIEMDGLPYSESLGGKGSIVADYIKNSLAQMDWLKELHPKANDLQTLHIQANFILALLITSCGNKTWPDFARYYGHRLNHIISKLKYDNEFQEGFAKLFDTDIANIRKKLYEYCTIMEKRGLSNYWWESIRSEEILNDDEKREMELIK